MIKSLSIAVSGIKIIIASILLLVSVQANALLVEVDYVSTGDGLITRDTDTGLDWLEVTATVNLSYDYVSSQFGVGGEFEGWRYASIAEVESLYNAAGGSGNYELGWRVENNGVTETLAGFWGWSEAFARRIATIVNKEIPTGDCCSTSHMITTAFDSTQHAENATMDYFNTTNPGERVFDYESAVWIGSALVRESAPEPTSVTIDISGGGIQECISPEGNEVLLTANTILGEGAVLDSTQWSIDENYAGDGNMIMPTLSLGTHNIEVVVTTTTNGEPSEATATAIVEIQDTTEPVLFMSFVDGRTGEAITQIDKANAQWIIASFEAQDVCDIDPIAEGRSGFSVANGDQLKVKGSLGQVIFTPSVLELFVTSTDDSGNTTSDTATLEFIE